MQITPNVEQSNNSLVFDIIIDGVTIAKGIVATDRSISVQKSGTPFGTVNQSTPIVESTSSVITSSEFSPISF